MKTRKFKLLTIISSLVISGNLYANDYSHYSNQIQNNSYPNVQKTNSTNVQNQLITYPVNTTRREQRLVTYETPIDNYNNTMQYAQVYPQRVQPRVQQRVAAYYPNHQYKVRNPVAQVSQTSNINTIKQKKVIHNNAKYTYNIHTSLNESVIELANRLLNSSQLHNNMMNDIAITSFVDLHKLNKTTHFGRTLGESMFDELFVRGFKVNDFRGQNNLTINAAGEYFITRDINLLKKRISNSYVLVGTYSMFEGKMSINARILDNKSGQVVASGRSYYKSNDCRILENCKKPRVIKIVTDNCSSVGCPSKSCPQGICGKTANYNIKRDNQQGSIKIAQAGSNVNHNSKISMKNNPRNNLAISLIK